MTSWSDVAESSALSDRRIRQYRRAQKFASMPDRDDNEKDITKSTRMPHEA